MLQTTTCTFKTEFGEKTITGVPYTVDSRTQEKLYSARVAVRLGELASDMGVGETRQYDNLPLPVTSKDVARLALHVLHCAAKFADDEPYYLLEGELAELGDAAKAWMAAKAALQTQQKTN
jgi:hypothetical protein